MTLKMTWTNDRLNKFAYFANVHVFSQYTEVHVEEANELRKLY